MFQVEKNPIGDKALYQKGEKIFGNLILFEMLVYVLVTLLNAALGYGLDLLSVPIHGVILFFLYKGNSFVKGVYIFMSVLGLLMTAFVLLGADYSDGTISPLVSVLILSSSIPQLLLIYVMLWFKPVVFFLKVEKGDCSISSS